MVQVKIPEENIGEDFITNNLISVWGKWQLFMVLGLALGLAVGFGIVEADFATYQVDNGNNYYPGPGSNSYDRMSHTSSGNVPTHAYDQQWRLNGNADYPGATSARLIQGRYKHAQSGSSKACFWKTKITTEAGSNTRWGSIWKGLTLQSGLDSTKYVGWEYNNFHSSDKNLNVSQIMVVPFFNNAPCSAGMSGSTAMEHYSDWEVH